jgi:hypothetical protein
VLAQASKGWAGTGSDPRVRTIMVIDHPNIHLAVAHSRRAFHWGRYIWVCKTVAEALDLARAKVVEEQRADEPSEPSQVLP